MSIIITETFKEKFDRLEAVYHLTGRTIAGGDLLPRAGLVKTDKGKIELRKNALKPGLKVIRTPSDLK